MDDQPSPEGGTAPESRRSGLGCFGTALLIALSAGVFLIPFVSTDVEGGRREAIALMLKWWPVGAAAGIVLGIAELSYLKRRRPSGPPAIRALMWPIGIAGTIFFRSAAPETLGVVCGLFSGLLLPYGLLDKGRRRAMNME